MSLKRDIEPREREAARRRQEEAGARGKEGGRGKKKDNPSADSAEGLSGGDSRDIVADMIGTGRDRLTKAEAVVAAAEKDPETFGPIKDEMNKTGNVNGAYKKVEAAKKPPPEPPRHPYSDVNARCQSTSPAGPQTGAHGQHQSRRSPP